jgi:hypothetical protein
MHFRSIKIGDGNGWVVLFYALRSLSHRLWPTPLLKLLVVLIDVAVSWELTI